MRNVLVLWGPVSPHQAVSASKLSSTMRRVFWWVYYHVMFTMLMLSEFCLNALFALGVSPCFNHYSIRMCHYSTTAWDHDARRVLRGELTFNHGVWGYLGLINKLSRILGKIRDVLNHQLDGLWMALEPLSIDRFVGDICDPVRFRVDPARPAKCAKQAPQQHQRSSRCLGHSGSFTAGMVIYNGLGSPLLGPRLYFSDRNHEWFSNGMFSNGTSQMAALNHGIYP